MVRLTAKRESNQTNHDAFCFLRNREFFQITHSVRNSGLKYDEENDSLYVSISSKRASLSVEISPRISIDISQSGRRPVGVEILEASKVLSDLFGRVVLRQDVRNILCTVTSTDAIYLNFNLDGNQASLAVQKAYQSPLLAAATN